MCYKDAKEEDEAAAAISWPMYIHTFPVHYVRIYSGLCDTFTFKTLKSRILSFNLGLAKLSYSQVEID